jgi:purine nucleosidase
MQKIILDTDIGNDIDDAICLAYLLAQPECDLLGITTVTGQPARRAEMVSAQCTLAGRDIPIYPGAPLTLLNGQKQPECYQAVSVAHWPHHSNFPQGEAITFLSRTIRAHPGEITLLAIGPLTNIALLFRTDPEIPALLKGLVMMCGVFTNRRAGVGPLEWNALVDPHATAVVYNTPVAVHRSIGLDVTTQVTLPPAELLARCTHPFLQPVADIIRAWYLDKPRITFHDPLAAATLFNKRVCTFERGQVEVDLASPRFAGHTHWSPGPATPHEVALGVDPDAFIEEYFSVFQL